MVIRCEKCKKNYRLPDEKVPSGAKFSIPCPSCKENIQVQAPTRNKQSAKQPAPKPMPKASPKKPPPSESAPKPEVAPLPPPKAPKDEFELDMVGEIKGMILASVKELPPMPKVLYRVREIMTDPKANFEDIAAALETDQAITVAVLKMANSAYYGMSGKVSSVRQASVLLGIRTLGQIISVASASRLLTRKLVGYQMETELLWRHSISVAFGAKLIAKLVRPDLESDAFNAGLIHDMGMLVLDPFIADRKEIFHEFVQKDDRNHLHAERDALGVDHAEISYECCKKWSFPHAQSLAIRYHHNPMGAPDKDLACIIYAANMITKKGCVDLGGFDMYDNSGNQVSTGDEVKQHLNLSDNDIKTISDEMVRAVEDLDL